MSKFLSFLCAVFVFLAIANTYTLQAQTITTIEKVIDYQLPYPGLLPDNPLYVFKQLRDSIQLMLANGPLEKSKVQLQIADKNMAAAVELTNKGKHKLTQERIETAEELMGKIITTLEKQADKMDKQERSDFIGIISKANLKHRETIETLMKNTPSGQVEQLEKLRQKNLTHQENITKLR